MAVMLRFPSSRTGEAAAAGRREPPPGGASIVILPCIRREPLGPERDLPLQLKA